MTGPHRGSRRAARALKTLTTAPLRWALRHAGYELVQRGYPPDFEPHEIDTLEAVRPYTMTSPERVVSLCRAVEYVARHHIAGACVECGVWRGGSMMAVARTLRRLGQEDRELYLFDTFEGMTEPTAHDVSYQDQSALSAWDQAGSAQNFPWRCEAPRRVVETAMTSTGYDPAKIHYIEGRVEETIPDQAPAALALLRLDTDWYESTRHEFEHLFPRLAVGGVLIIDDYGHWSGARRATDEYLARTGTRLLLSRIDYTGRIGVKLEPLERFSMG